MLATVKAELGNAFDSDQTMFDALEWLLCNSELEWSSPEEIGALTSAPILAIYGDTRLVNHREAELTGKVTVREIQQAWGFMDYQVRSVQGALLETGEAKWQKGFQK